MGETANISELLRHSAWMRRLALGLSRDEASADDLVQEGWAAALRSPPLASLPARPWLGEVLRNAWRMGLRESARRRQREAEVPGPLPVPHADELVGESELRRLLAEEVLALEAPDREVLLFSYFEGLNSAEIGERLGLAAGTVRWRLKEALVRLRRRLDRRDGEWRAWLGALAPLPAARSPFIRQAPVSTAASALRLGVAASVTAAAALGSWALTQPLLDEPVASFPAVASPAAAPIPPARAEQSRTPAAADPPSHGRLPTPAAADPFPQSRPTRALNPESRQALLAQIFAALIAAHPAGARSVSAPRSRLDKDYIQTELEGSIKPLVQACYAQALRTQPLLSGRLTVRFSIVGDPSVGGLVGESHILDDRSSIADPELRTCVEESLYAARFPPPPTGGEVQVEYPYTFASRGGEKAEGE